MAFKSTVSFVFTNINLGNLPPLKDVHDLDQFKSYINYHDIRMPYKVSVARIINIINERTNEITQIKDDELIFYVSDKISYPEQIHTYMKKYYGDEKYFFSPGSDNAPGLLDAVVPEGANACAKWHILTDSDIVVDKNLHQIWKNKTGKTPLILLNLFKRTKEHIRAA